MGIEPTTRSLGRLLFMGLVAVPFMAMMLLN